MYLFISTGYNYRFFFYLLQIMSFNLLPNQNPCWVLSYVISFNLFIKRKF